LLSCSKIHLHCPTSQKEQRRQYRGADSRRFGFQNPTTGRVELVVRHHMHHVYHNHQLRPRVRSRGGAAVRRDSWQRTAKSPPGIRKTAHPAQRIGLGVFPSQAKRPQHLGCEISAMEIAVGCVCVVCRGRVCLTFSCRGVYNFDEVSG